MKKKWQNIIGYREKLVWVTHFRPYWISGEGIHKIEEPAEQANLGGRIREVTEVEEFMQIKKINNLLGPVPAP